MSDSPAYFYINQKPVNVEIGDLDMTLLEFLHERQDLTGTKFGCGIGVCHACTVGVRATGADAKQDTKAGAKRQPPLIKVLACTTQVSAMRGFHIETVEGLSASPLGTNLQNAFLRHFAFQCGYCTPGFLMAAKIMIENLPPGKPPSKQELNRLIDVWVGDNLCRCTGYLQYREAIQSVVLGATGSSRCAK